MSRVVATGLKSITVVLGCASISGPRRRWAVKLSFEAMAVDWWVSVMMRMMG